jgi:hypothetical protein
MKKIIGIFICTLLFIPVFSISVTAESNTNLDIQIFGGLPLPLLIKNTGGVITNIGDTTAYNISFNLTIIGGPSSDINIVFEDSYEKLDPVSSGGNALGIFTSEVFGFGIITITLTASASNADSVTAKAKGIQIGDFTWIPLSWIIPRILKDFIPWFDFE